MRARGPMSGHSMKFLRRRGFWIGGEVYHWKAAVLVIFEEHIKRVRSNPNRYKQYGLDL